MSSIKRFIVFVLLLCLSLPAFAQEVATEFLIERIEVRGVRFASDSVVAEETLIVPGRSYSETALRDAVHRVNRLPFVLDSEFSLEKGNERGTYILVITVQETKPLFYSFSQSFNRSEQYSSSFEQYGVGGRWFSGRNTLVYAATDLDNHFEVGATQYNLFRRGSYLSANVRFGDLEHEFSAVPVEGAEPIHYKVQVEPGVSVRAGAPLFGNHSLHLTVERNGDEANVVTQFAEYHDEREWYFTNLHWIYDTTDDVIAPTRGTRWQTGLHGNFSEDSSDEVNGDYDQRSETSVATLFTDLGHYFPITSHQSILVGGGVGRSRFDAEREGLPTLPATYGNIYAARAGMSTALWPQRFTDKYGDLRLEVQANFNRFGPGFDARYYNAQLLQRNAWGTVRFAFQYDDSENE